MPTYQYNRDPFEVAKREKRLGYRYLNSRRRRLDRWMAAGGRAELLDYCNERGECLACRCIREKGTLWCEYHARIWSPERLDYERCILTGVCIACREAPAEFYERKRNTVVRAQDGELITTGELEAYTIEYCICGLPDCELELQGLMELALFQKYALGVVRDPDSRPASFEAWAKSTTRERDNNLNAQGYLRNEGWHGDLKEDDQGLVWQRWVVRLFSQWRKDGPPGALLYRPEGALNPENRPPPKVRCRVRGCQARSTVQLEPLPLCRRHAKGIVARIKGDDRCMLRGCQEPPETFIIPDNHVLPGVEAVQLLPFCAKHRRSLQCKST